MHERERVYKVKEAAFVATAPNVGVLQTIPDGGPEVAFIGRSNVGKSSLINALVERKRLVRTSKTPGHTRALQLFDVVIESPDGVRNVRIVDLPGYGYARASQQERLRMSALVAGYLEHRGKLAAVVQLFDSRQLPTSDDLRIKAQVLNTTTSYIVVATKADKLPASKRKPAKFEIAKRLERAQEDVILVSASSPIGRSALWSRIWDSLPNA